MRPLGGDSCKKMLLQRLRICSHSWECSNTLSSGEMAVIRCSTSIHFHNPGSAIFHASGGGRSFQAAVISLMPWRKVSFAVAIASQSNRRNAACASAIASLIWAAPER